MPAARPRLKNTWRTLRRHRCPRLRKVGWHSHSTVSERLWTILPGYSTSIPAGTRPLPGPARLRLGRYQESLADLDPLIEHYPRDPVLLELRSQVHDRLGHKEQAQSDLKRSLGSPLATARHYNNQAWTLANGPKATRDPDQALVLARKAVALTPGTAIYFNTLGAACTVLASMPRPSQRSKRAWQPARANPTRLTSISSRWRATRSASGRGTR